MFGRLKKLWLTVETLAIQIQLLQHDVAQLKEKKNTVAKKPVVKKTK
jgi:FtsZ-binding cell division protein ZapB